MMNKKKIIIAVLVVAVLFSLSYFVAKSWGSGFGNYGRELGGVITSKNNPVVATVNGEPVYLSDVAFPYFSMTVSYIRTKPALMDYINNPKVSESVKEEAKKSLSYVPEPEDILNREINMVLLDQYMLRNGAKIPSSVISNQAKEAMRQMEKANGMWKKYQTELIKSLGTSENEYYTKYYTRLLKQLYPWNQYKKSLKVPEFSESKIKAEVEKNGGNKELAIETLKNRYLESQAELKAELLRKTANIKITNINAVKELRNYFSNLYKAKP